MPGMKEAVISGQIGEYTIEKILDYLKVSYKKKYRVYENIFYGSYNDYEFYCDSIKLTIESKRQKVSGSVDEKWAYNIFKFLFGSTPGDKFLMIFQGNEPRKNYYEFLKNIKTNLKELLNKKMYDRFCNNFYFAFSIDEARKIIEDIIEMDRW